MRCCTSVLASFAALPAAAQSAPLSPAELTFLDGEDGCAAVGRGRAECSLSLLQYRMTRMSTDPTNEASDDVQNGRVDDMDSADQDDKDDVGGIHSAAAASSVEDILHRADNLAEKLKAVTEAADSDGGEHSAASSSAKTLKVLDETIGNIKVKADKIAAKLHDAEKLQDGGESIAKSNSGKHAQQTKFGNAHLAINKSKAGVVRPWWSKSLDDMASTSAEAHLHSKSKAATEASNGRGSTSEEAPKHANRQFAATGGRSFKDVHSAKGGTTEEEQQGRTKPSHEKSTASIKRSSVNRGDHHLDSGKQFQHDKRSDVTKHSAGSDTFTSHSHSVDSVKMKTARKLFQHDDRSDDIDRRHSFSERSEASDDLTAHSDSVISIKMEKLEDKFDDADASLCESGRVIDFGAAKVIHNNLGGAGPDKGEENIVYEGVAAVDGAEVNLVVTALSPYKPYNAKKNGVAGVFGQINLQVDTKVDLSFTFVYSSGGDDATMEPFYFSFVDLDQGMAPLSEEKVTVKGFESYRLSEDTEVLFKARGDDVATFSSSWRGGKVDNPSNPMSLNKLEKDRTVTAVFQNISKFEVTFEETGYSTVQGRNFLFSGVSDLVCPREQKCANFKCPEGFHLRQRAEFLVCVGRSCDADDRDLCCFAEAPM